MKIYFNQREQTIFILILKETLKWSFIFRYMKERATLTLKIKSKTPAESHFSFKQAEKVEKLMFL